MCGVCGVAFADSQRTVDAGTVRRMNATLEHRGPDDVGLHVAGQVGLGHRRLSIVDLSKGHQPMVNDDESIAIVFNGEIYNHRDLRDALRSQGHAFRTDSDTEAILRQYEQSDLQCVQYLRGMFAFAIWDARRGRLLLARDHSGIKPLYYAFGANGSLVFGSEIKALAASGLVEVNVNHSALPEHLATGHVSGGNTLLAGIHKLPPGHLLTWESGRHSLVRYWGLGGSQPQRAQGSTVALLGEEFWRGFLGAVKEQLMADVPLGVFLSGGLDSTLLVAAMHELGVQGMDTFSVGFAEGESSELPQARLVSEHFGTRHHEVVLDAARFFDLVPVMTGFRDLPLTFFAGVPLFAVSELAATRVKVVLSGEGSDELFAGYGRYPTALWNLRWARRLDRWLPAGLRKALSRATLHAGEGWLGSRLRRSFIGQSGSIARAYCEAFAEIGEPLRDKLLPEARGRWNWEEARSRLDQGLVEANPLEALLRLDQQTYMEELLMKQDSMSMAASIESRVPYLDHRMIEWASHLPARAKLEGRTGKRLVRAAAAARLPLSLRDPEKRGFPVPLARWFREPLGRKFLEDQLFVGIHGSALTREGLLEPLKQHADGRDRTGVLWRLCAFRVWENHTLPALREAASGGRG